MKLIFNEKKFTNVHKKNHKIYNFSIKFKFNNNILKKFKTYLRFKQQQSSYYEND